MWLTLFIRIGGPLKHLLKTILGTQFHQTLKFSPWEHLSSLSRKRTAVYDFGVNYCGLNKISKKDCYSLPLYF